MDWKVCICSYACKVIAHYMRTVSSGSRPPNTYEKWKLRHYLAGTSRTTHEEAAQTGKVCSSAQLNLLVYTSYNNRSFAVYSLRLFSQPLLLMYPISLRPPGPLQIELLAYGLQSRFLAQPFMASA